MEKAVKGISDEERGKTRLDDRYRCQPHPDFRDKEENKKQRSYTDANTSLNTGGQGSWLVMEVEINYCVDLVETCLGTATCLTFRRHRCNVKIRTWSETRLIKWHRTKTFSHSGGYA